MHHAHVDRILCIQPGCHARAIKCVSLSDAALSEHFPGNPILPGVFLLEGIAQTAGVLLWKSTDEQRLAVMASIDRARFLCFARPGDSLHLDVDIETLTSDHARIIGHARCGEAEVANVRMTFRLIEPSALIAAAYLPAFLQMLSTWLGNYPEASDA
jgi:3-hydroxyacyl-[acyl-carrier-protein] dehydratase